MDFNTEVSIELSSSNDDDHCDSLLDSDSESENKRIQNSPPTPYDRFMDFCDDARVDWEQFLQDRDERL